MFQIFYLLHLVRLIKIDKTVFEVLGDPFQPFIYGQYNYPLHASVMYNIPLVMYGENGEVEYGGDMKMHINQQEIKGRPEKALFFEFRS